MALEVSEGMMGLVRKLGHTDKEPRDKAVEMLKMFLSSRRAKTTNEIDFLKLWKGLFYCMWMSDKTHIQQELAAVLASLVHRFSEPELAALWLRTFYMTMCREWAGIDKYRLDKYYSLMRKVLHESFSYLRESSWNGDCVSAVAQNIALHFTSHEDSKRQGIGVTMHYFEIFMEELFKSVGASISTSNFEALFIPVLKGYSLTANMDKRFLKCIETSIFDVLAVDYWFKDCQDQMAKEDDDSNKTFRCTKLAKIAAHVWAVACDPQTVQQRRKLLYAVHKNLKLALRASGTHYTVTVAPLAKEMPSMPFDNKNAPSPEGKNLLDVEDEESVLRNGSDDEGSNDDLNDSTATEKLYGSDEEDEEEGSDVEEDGWSSDECRDLHGPALPPGWNTEDDNHDPNVKDMDIESEKEKERKRKAKKHVSIQLQNNQYKAYRNSVRDLKRRKLKIASQSPEPQASILKKETDIQKRVGELNKQLKSEKGKKRKKKASFSMQLNTMDTSYSNSFDVLRGAQTSRNSKRKTKKKKRN